MILSFAGKTRTSRFALLSVLQSESFRSEVSCLGGYDLEHTGEILAEM